MKEEKFGKNIANKEVPWSKLLNYNRALQEKIEQRELKFERQQQLKRALQKQIREKQNISMKESQIEKMNDTALLRRRIVDAQKRNQRLLSNSSNKNQSLKEYLTAQINEK